MRYEIEETWAGIQMDVAAGSMPVVDDKGRPVHDAHGLPKVTSVTVLVWILNEAGGRRIIKIPLSDDARRVLVTKLTGGVVLPGNGVI